MLEHGFNWLATDWHSGDAAQAEQYIQGETDDPDAWRLLHHLYRWPSWHWANSEVALLLSELRAFNSGRAQEDRLHLMGLGDRTFPGDALDLLLLQSDGNRPRKCVVWSSHEGLASPRFGALLKARYEAQGVARVTMMAASGEIVASPAPDDPYETMSLAAPEPESWEAVLDEAARVGGCDSFLAWTESWPQFALKRRYRSMSAIYDPRPGAQADYYRESASLLDCDALLFVRRVHPVEPVHVPFARLAWAI